MNLNKISLPNLVIAIKGAGDLASGIALKLFKSNIKNIYMMEIKNPSTIRRTVSFSEAIYKGSVTVEEVTSILSNSYKKITQIKNNNKIPILIDPKWEILKLNPPHILIDAIMAKKNIGTKITDAPLVIGLGPGFVAKYDVDIVIETKRGHNLGKIIHYGTVKKNNSIPKKINGFSIKRILKSPTSGFFLPKRKIGDFVKKNDIIGSINNNPISTQINGVIRGLIHHSVKIKKNMKIGDIDPRGNSKYCYSISDKARSIGGAVLETIIKKIL